jgi:hypothetical protein
MDSGFEVHPKGTATELRLSRELVRVMEKSGGVLPSDISTTLEELTNFHTKQITEETL